MPILVGKVDITDDEVHAEMQYHPAATLEDARHRAAEALVIRQLLLQEAKHKELLNPLEPISSEAEESAIDALLKQEVSVPVADEMICSRYYQQNQMRFKDQKTGEPLPLESVKNHIRDYLYAQSLQTGISQYIKVLSGKTRIAGFDFDGSDTPLVQ